MLSLATLRELGRLVCYIYMYACLKKGCTSPTFVSLVSLTTPPSPGSPSRLRLTVTHFLFFSDIGEKMYSTGVDTWSVGCIFGELVKGSPMFQVCWRDVRGVGSGGG